MRFFRMSVLWCALAPSAFARPNINVLFEGIPVSNGLFFHITGLDDDEGRTEHFSVSEDRVLTQPSVLILREAGIDDALTAWAQDSLDGRDIPKKIIGTRRDRGASISSRIVRGEGCSVTKWRRDTQTERFELVCESFEKRIKS